MPPPSNRRVWISALILLALGVALYLPLLGASGLWDPWEPKYAQTAREMSERGSWVVPYYREDPRTNKPPLTYWLIAASHAVFGVDETAARMPSALLAIGAAVALGLAFSIRGRPLEGLLAGGALLTSSQWLLVGRFATPDMPLAASLGVALALTIALGAVERPRTRRILLACIVVCIAAAVMTDGLRGLWLPVCAVLGWGALREGWRGAVGIAVVLGLYHAAQLRYSVTLNLTALALAVALAAWWLVTRAGLRPRSLALGAGLFALLVVPWFVALWSIVPDEMWVFAYNHAFNLGETRGNHTGPYDYPLRIVLVGSWPWAAVAFVGLITGFGKRRDDLATLLGGAGLGGVLFFTLCEAQMGHFYGVIQPAVAGLAGIGAVAFVRRRDWTAFAALAALAGVSWLALGSPARFLEGATVKRNLYGLDLVLPAALCGGLWLAVMSVARLRRREAWTAAALLPAALFSGVLAFWLVPTLEPKKSLRPMWERYLAVRQEGEPIAAFNRAKHTGYYYSNLSIVRVKGGPGLSQYLAGPGAKYLVMVKNDWKRVTQGDPRHASRFRVVDNSHVSHLLVRYAGPTPPGS